MGAFDRRRFLGACIAGAGLTLITGGQASAADIPATVRDVLRRGLALGLPGIACGVTYGDREYTAGAGHAAGPDSPAPDARTLFQLGSITKTFTALAAAEAETRGRLSLRDPLADHLHANWTVPQRGPRPITLSDLATHTSGLPRLPADLFTTPGFDPLNPYAHYTREFLANGLRHTELSTDPGSTYGYSNFGFAMLGQALGGSFDPALRSIALPLGMPDTTTRLTPGQRSRKATGHNLQGSEVPDWTGAPFAPAGAGTTFSTVRDLLRYLRAQLTPAHTPFAESIRKTHVPRFTVNEEVSVGLGWHRSPLPGGQTMIWHDGGTGGFSTFVAFEPSSRTGVALMANRTVDPNAGENLNSLGKELLLALRH
ncbi:class A beta-lactamase-related serine hydrolase [Pseudonocardiaceae bacterium YIM PH 21723]|nr:class A beta-lactamase-related serine hydrolase [Pseudonocardiaceae bacterium YIM PH 21723]